MRRTRNAKIVATLGPASSDPQVIERLFVAGVDVFRLNFSHGSAAGVDESKLRRVRNILARHEASLLFDQYDDDWSRLGYVLVHGYAGLIQPDDALHTP